MQQQGFYQQQPHPYSGMHPMYGYPFGWQQQPHHYWMPWMHHQPNMQPGVTSFQQPLAQQPISIQNSNTTLARSATYPAAITPQQQQQVQQSLQNPDQGDGFSRESRESKEEPLPFTPFSVEGAAGGVLGMGAAALLTKVFNFEDLSESRLIKAAQALDNLPGVSWVSKGIKTHVLDKLAGKGDWSKVVASAHTAEELEGLLLKQYTHALESSLVEKGLSQAAVTELKTIKNLAELEKFYTKHGVSGGYTALFRSVKTMDWTKIKESLTNLERQRILDGLLRRGRGVSSHFISNYKNQQQLFEALGKETGVVGRLFTTGMNYLRRIFGGETMAIHVTEDTAEAGLKASFKQGLNKFFGPILQGAFIFGTAFHEAKDAGEGEKTKTFFHHVLGPGLGNFVGWEIGRAFLNKTGLFTRYFAKFGAKPLLGALNFIPLLGRITWGGFIIEMLAMFVLSKPFEKLGEMIANKVFGEPEKIKQERLSHGKKPLPTAQTGAQAGGFQNFNQQQQRLALNPGA